MNNLQTKYLFFVVLLFIAGAILVGCVKEIELEVPQKKSQAAVDCFFTTDTTWSVKLYETFDLNLNEPENSITNANVMIISNTSDTIFLHHTNNGVYVSDSNPKAGVEYELIVDLDGKETIKAKSSIPQKSSISKVELDLALQTVISDYNMWTEMISVSFIATPHQEYNSLCRVHILKFDPIEGYKRYFFDDESLERMLKMGVTETIVNHLRTLHGQIIFGPLWNTLIQIIGEVNSSENLTEIEEATFLDEVDYQDPNAFAMVDCISSSGIFYQAPYETYTLLGDFNTFTPIKIYTMEFYDGEYSLEYVDMSKEYYQFQKDYSLQLSNRGNLNAPPVIVYSNIKNGMGIFAGYQKQLICLDE